MHCSPINLLQEECEETGDITDDNANYNNDDGGSGIEESKDELKIEINEEQDSLDIDVDQKHNDENDS
jgi:hypothetical protein